MTKVFHGLTAQRFAGKPLRQPNYSMRDVPRSNQQLTGSTICEVTDREHFNEAMAEMVLLCNEVMRRKSQQPNAKTKKKKDEKKKKASKPLSLEYIADRCDVDDPIWGFIVRSAATQMMQGFITVTTFTNWQKSFRWDSMHDSAFSYDEPDIALEMAEKIRNYDEDGSLAAEIQNTVRCGDPWNEGIVWPRVAEISLLGALGCGKVLLSLVIERLETMASNQAHNYDYVVLQATDNSISFYESMGFKRVGALTENNQNEVNENQQEETKDTREKGEIVTGPIVKVRVKTKESLRKFCKRMNVDVWDVIFLNKDIFPGISHKSVIQNDTELFITDTAKLDGGSNAGLNPNGSESSVTQWYDAQDNETPREIARKFNLTLKNLLAANKGRIQGLQANSKLVKATRIQVSNLDVHFDAHVPYCHWTFPDDKFENNEPSYMMARKLNRQHGQATKLKPVEESLAEKMSKYEPPSFLKEAEKTPMKTNTMKSPSTTPKRSSKKRKLHPDEPLPPKRPKTGYFFFLDAERIRMKESDIKQNTKEFIKAASTRWNILSLKEKSIYEMKREEALIDYEKQTKEYHIQMEKFKAEHPDWDKIKIEKTPEKVKKGKNLFNKVVRLSEEGRRETGTEFEYYYVLTYIPDLFWCHLAPMRRMGTFGTKWPKVKGRTRWALVGEDEGKEFDISAAVCEIVRSRCMKRCNDADKEEWDISDPANEKSPIPGSASSSASIVSASSAKEVTTTCSESETDTDQKGLITKDTMYCRLLRKQYC